MDIRGSQSVRCPISHSGSQKDERTGTSASLIDPNDVNSATKDIVGRGNGFCFNHVLTKRDFEGSLAHRANC